MTAEAERPLPANCPLCNAPIAADHGEHSGWLAHPASADCPLSLFAFPVEQLAAWNRRAPDAQVRALTEERDRLRAALGDGNRPLPFDRDELGRFVRDAWVRWAQTQPTPKASWLVPFDDLPEHDKEADRLIGEAVARWTLIGDAARAALGAP